MGPGITFQNKQIIPIYWKHVKTRNLPSKLNKNTFSVFVRRYMLRCRRDYRFSQCLGLIAELVVSVNRWFADFLLLQGMRAWSQTNRQSVMHHRSGSQWLSICKNRQWTVYPVFVARTRKHACEYIDFLFLATKNKECPRKILYNSCCSVFLLKIHTQVSCSY